MHMILVSIRDSAVGTFGRPVFVHSINQAIRSFGDEINRESGGDLNKHPADFELFEIGSFDDHTGVVTSHPQPLAIVRGKDLVQEK